MNTIKLQELTQKTIPLILQSGEYLRSVFLGGTSSLEATEKDDLTIATEADYQSERLLIAGLHDIAPDIPIYAEESGIDNSTLNEKDALWLVDPLDGTTSFAQGFPNFAVSLSLASSKGDFVYSSIVYEPITGRLWRAVVGEGTYLDVYNLHTQTLVSSEKVVIEKNKRNKRKSLVVYDASLRFLPHIANAESKVEKLAKVFPHYSAARLIGSNVLQFAYVASSFADASITDAIGGAWDIAPLLLVKEAGGVVSDLANQDINIFKNDIVVASNGTDHSNILSSLCNEY